MTSVELSAGTVEYTDTGGDGPVLVLLHGLMMDASLWDGVIAGLSSSELRCVAPTLPLGAHRHPMRPGFELPLRGIAQLVAEFTDRLDLTDVTLAGNDTGGALLPDGRLVEVEDSYTLIPLDQPARLTSIIREFTSAR
jgi:pimeloyl-ACP methyl ester carboxylesterase